MMKNSPERKSADFSPLIAHTQASERVNIGVPLGRERRKDQGVHKRKPLFARIPGVYTRVILQRDTRESLSLFLRLSVTKK